MEIFYNPLFTLFCGVIVGVGVTILVRKSFCDGCSYVDYWLRTAATVPEDDKELKP